MVVDEDRVRQLAASLQKRASGKLREYWWAFLIRGILALMLAGLALGWPQQTMGVLIKLLGGYFLIDSIPNLYLAWRREKKIAYFLTAILNVALGLVLLLWTGISVRVFLVLVGLWTAWHGISLLWSSRGLSPDEPERGALSTIGWVLLAVGIVLAIWPETGVVAVSWLISACSAIVGFVLVFLANKLRQLRVALLNISTRRDVVE
jgi:uncharacterized membrane protein HdeD (DUF308 family)